MHGEPAGAAVQGAEGIAYCAALHERFDCIKYSFCFCPDDMNMGEKERRAKCKYIEDLFLP